MFLLVPRKQDVAKLISFDFGLRRAKTLFVQFKAPWDTTCLTDIQPTTAGTSSRVEY